MNFAWDLSMRAGTLCKWKRMRSLPTRSRGTCTFEFRCTHYAITCAEGMQFIHLLKSCNFKTGIVWMSS